MYKIIFSLILLCTLTVNAYAQEQEEAKVSRRRVGLQISSLASGAWIYHEARLADQFSLRTEVGLEGCLLLGKENLINGYSYRPAINLEPRWYYNLNKRLAKGKSITGNSGNFFAFRINYHPKLFAVYGGDFAESDPNGLSQTLSLIPVWGIRRKLGKHFNFEASGGMGLDIRHFGMGERADAYTIFRPHLNLRIGYDF